MSPSPDHPYFYHEENFPPNEVAPFIQRLIQGGFELLETSVGRGEVVKTFCNLDGEEVMIIVDLQGVEVTSDFGAGPVVRDRG